jgi:peptidyl-prolyl cis-trans isomerase D
MMRTMRSIAPWIMLVVAVAFVGWMVFDVGMDIQGRGSGAADEVARINGRKIDQQTFYAAVRNTQELQRQQGVPAPRTIEEQRELETAVLEQLIQDVLLNDEYRRRDLGVSDREVRDALMNSPLPEIQSIPDFQTEGQFDLAKYQRYLQADRSFALALEARYREEIPRIKFLDRVTEDVYVSDAKLWRIFRDQHDSVTADIVALVPSVVVRQETVSITDEETEQYYREHRDDFDRPARAFLSFVALSRRPNAADSAAALRRAQALRAEIVGGVDFAEVALRESADSISRENGGDLGEVALGRFVPSFEEAALALRPGQISQPVLTDFGYHIIRLESKRDTSFQARHVLVPIELYGEHLDEVDRRADSLDLFAADLDDPTALDTVAHRLGIDVAAAPVLTDGNRLQLGRFVVPDAHIWAFEAAAGQTSPIIETDWAYYVFRLDSLVPAGVAPLEEVREQAQRLAISDEQWNGARGLATEIQDAIARGLDLRQVADSFSLRVERQGPFTRVTPPPALRDIPDAIGAAFGLPLAQPSGPYESEFGLFFVEPLRKRFADSTAFLAAKDSLHADLIQQARSARVQLIISSLREEASVVDRREELERARRQAENLPVPGSPLGF